MPFILATHCPWSCAAVLLFLVAGTATSTHGFSRTCPAVSTSPAALLSSAPTVSVRWPPPCMWHAPASTCMRQQLLFLVRTRCCRQVDVPVPAHRRANADGGRRHPQPFPADWQVQPALRRRAAHGKVASGVPAGERPRAQPPAPTLTKFGGASSSSVWSSLACGPGCLLFLAASLVAMSAVHVLGAVVPGVPHAPEAVRPRGARPHHPQQRAVRRPEGARRLREPLHAGPPHPRAG